MSSAAMDSTQSERSARRRAPVLWALLALFVLRVTGQALVAFLGVRWLPPMPEWYSGLLPYPFLLPSQILIILLLGAVCRDFTRGHGWFVTPRPGWGRWVPWLGAAYFAAMVVRYAVQMTLHPERRWLGGSIPILFHCVLAAFLIIFGQHHRGHPTLMKGAAA